MVTAKLARLTLDQVLNSYGRYVAWRSSTRLSGGGGISFGRSHGNVNSSSGVRDGLDNGVRERGVGSNA